MNSEELERVVHESQRLVGEGRYEDNRELLQRTLRDDPDEVEIVLRTGLARATESPAEAARLARQAAQLEPEDPSTLMRASSLLLALEQLDEARALCARAMAAVEEGFGPVVALYHLAGRIAVLDGNLEVAEQLLRPPFEEQPDVAGYGEELAFLLESQERWDEALEVAERTLEQFPGDPEMRALAAACRVNLYGPEFLPPDASIDHE